jgi:cytoskeletal protein CcmA (bactofilin family)
VLDVVAGAVVEAEIMATVVRIGGQVVGNITASERVELFATAHVKGDLTTPALHVVEGATLDGRVQMRAGPPAAPAPAGPVATS